jgi:lipopolysaccharide transport system permease protein
MTADQGRNPVGELIAEGAMVAGYADGTAERSPRPLTVIGPPEFSFRMVLTGVHSLIQYSDLLYALSVFRLRIRYKQSILGWLWAVLQPLALMGIYTLVFAHVVKVDTGGIAYPIFVFCGLLPWLFFSSSISSAVQGIVAYPSLLTKMYFPREIIPLSYLAASAVDFCIASVILAALLIHYRVAPTWNLLYSIPILFMLGGLTTAVALLCSAVQVRIRDVGLALPFVLQVWIFATPVVYSSQSVPPRFRTLYLLDPVAGAIESLRTAVLGRSPDTFTLAAGFAVTMAILLFAYAYFKRSEAAMADVV